MSRKNYTIMENKIYGGTGLDGADHSEDWQFADEQYLGGRESDDRSDEDDDEDEDEPTLNDWGDVDPQNNGIPDGNDPAAPGSAV